MTKRAQPRKLRMLASSNDAFRALIKIGKRRADLKEEAERKSIKAAEKSED